MINFVIILSGFMMDREKILNMHLLSNLIESAVIMPGEFDEDDEPVFSPRIDTEKVKKISEYFKKNLFTINEFERFVNSQWVWDSYTFSEPEQQAKIEFLIGAHSKEASEKRRLIICEKWEQIKSYLESYLEYE